MEYDPYKMLGVKYTDDLNKIRDCFKKLVLRYHPDRGGDRNVFEIIKKSYKYLYNVKKKEDKYLKNTNRNVNNIKKERKTFNNKMKDGYKNIQKLNKLNAKKFNKNNFNKLYEHFKIEDADDKGYEIQERSKERLDQSDIIKKYKVPKKMEIVIVKEPEPVESSKQNYKKLGLTHVDDFSKTHNSGQNFTDLQKAYLNRDILENNMQNSRSDNNLKNVDKQLSSLVSDRSNISYKMNKEDALQYHLGLEEEKTREMKRRMNFNNQNKLANRQFQRMQNYIKFN